MQKKAYIVSVLILVVIIVSIINTTPKTNYYITNSLSIKNAIPKQLPVAKLIIPKINLDGNLYNKNSNLNNVDINIKILDESIFPSDNNDTSIIFLAAHSGNSNNAYFNDLDKLRINDMIVFQYKNYNYFYTIDKITIQKKDGDIEVLKSSNNQLVLTTCSKQDMHKQLVVNSNLQKKEEIN